MKAFITNNQKATERHYVECSGKGEPCFTILTRGNYCRVWLNLWPWPFGLNKRGQEKAASFWDWYVHCVLIPRDLPKSKKGVGANWTIGSVDVYFHPALAEHIPMIARFFEELIADASNVEHI